MTSHSQGERMTPTTHRAAHGRLSKMHEDGLIIRRLVKSVAIWERHQEAAE